MVATRRDFQVLRSLEWRERAATEDGDTRTAMRLRSFIDRLRSELNTNYPALLAEHDKGKEV